MRNIKLLLEYDGTDYSGWQRQEHDRTVQGALEEAAFRLLQEKVNVIGAGRTDAGVHATGQVANFRSVTSLPLREINRGLNALLPDDIIVRGAVDVPEDFHARYGARERAYSYTITRTPTAIMRRYRWHVSYELSIDGMRWAAASILGSHDFTSFCKSSEEIDNVRCDVRAAKWEEEGPVLRFTIRADRFIHGMVRALVGTMVEVGRGHRTPEEFAGILERRDRSCAGQAAPACGLVLEEVSYPE